LWTNLSVELRFKKCLGTENVATICRTSSGCDLSQCVQHCRYTNRSNAVRQSSHRDMNAVQQETQDEKSLVQGLARVRSVAPRAGWQCSGGVRNGKEAAQGQDAQIQTPRNVNHGRHCGLISPTTPPEASNMRAPSGSA
jgi:hypothetical protein